MGTKPLSLYMIIESEASLQGGGVEEALDYFGWLLSYRKFIILTTYLYRYFRQE